MVVNFNFALIQQYQGSLIITDFLQQYQDLLLNLKTAFKDRNGESRNYSRTYLHVSNMKEFVIKSGAIRCVELLAEYEKFSAIGDYAACSNLEDSILGELNSFKEFWISMLS